MTLTIKPVESWWALHRFIGLPARLYRGMPGWVAPLRLERLHQLHPRKAPFFKVGQVRYWMAWRDGRPVGRISAQIDSRRPVGLPEATGMFGCLDAIDDPAVTRALLDTAFDWLRAQGQRHVFGPCTLSINEEAGLLVQGHLEPPMLLNPWHPPYLEAHLEAAGLKPLRDLHSWKLGQADYDATRIPARLIESASRIGVTLRTLDLRHIEREIDIICRLFNDAWRENWGFIPIGPDDLESLRTDLRPFMREEYGLFAEIDGKPVAMMLVFPNIFDISADVGCDPSPLGWLKLGYRRLWPQFRSGRIIMMGMDPSLRKSLTGAAVMTALFARTAEMTLKWRQNGRNEFLEGGWVLHDNRPVIQIMERFHFKPNRTFRLFFHPLEGAAPEGNGAGG